ncbi:Vacuolar protein sorting-associated protein 45-like [Vitis vinifera]|nr:Vacuolar protein sorting-associated protein 45-like [Vitis vinifera]
MLVIMEWQLVQFLLKQAGVDKRIGDLYGNRDLLNIARNMARGLKGVENVYTQHQPLLFQTMESINKGRLRDVDYPFIGNHFQQGRFVALTYLSLKKNDVSLPVFLIMEERLHEILYIWSIPRQPHCDRQCSEKFSRI